MAQLDFVTPEELNERLKDYDNNFAKLRELEEAFGAQQKQIDEIATELKNQPWSPEMENLLQQLAADRQATQLRFERLVGRSTKGYAPTDLDIEALTQTFDARYKLTDDIAARLDTLSGRLDEVQGVAKAAKDGYDWLLGWAKEQLGIGEDWNARNRLDEIEDRVTTLTGRVDTHDTQLSDHERRLLDLEKKNRFSFAPMVICMMVLGVVGGLAGYLWFSHWVIGAIVGTFLGAVIGFMLGSRKARRPKPRTTPRRTNGNSRATTRPGNHSA